MSAAFAMSEEAAPERALQRLAEHWGCIGRGIVLPSLDPVPEGDPT
jgi:hypothetical protein